MGYIISKGGDEKMSKNYCEKKTERLEKEKNINNRLKRCNINNKSV